MLRGREGKFEKPSACWTEHPNVYERLTALEYLDFFGGIHGIRRR